MNIASIIRDATQQYQDKTAVIHGNRQITYRELFAAADAVAEVLKACGVMQAQRVAFLCADSIEYISVSLAVLSLQAVIVPVPPSLAPDEIDAVLEQMNANYFIFDRESHAREGARQLSLDGACERTFYLLYRRARNGLPPDYFRLNPAFIRFSSGTTGASKGVLLSHEAIFKRTQAADTLLRITPGDVIIWVLSMSFHFVVTILLFLQRGAAIVLCGAPFPEALYEGLRAHKGTFLYASPFHYQSLISSPECTGDDMSNIRLAISTAMHLQPGVANDFHRKFRFELSQAYGIIEVGLPFINCSGDPLKRASVGMVLPDYEINIVNPDAEGIGEAYIKGPGMFDAYFTPWQRREEITVDGWFATGDVGKLDADGFLFLAGREKNVINFAGMKIFPYEVESVLNQHPAVQESCVYGFPHPQYGELPCAKIVPRDTSSTDIDSRDLRTFCYQRLAAYKVPKEFHLVQHLEKTASGKVRRW